MLAGSILWTAKADILKLGSGIEYRTETLVSVQIKLSSEPNVDRRIPSQSVCRGLCNKLQHDHYAHFHETSAGLLLSGRLHQEKK
jgi:hypothetical protein